MAYRDFKIETLEEKFGIIEIGTQIFDAKKIKRIAPSPKLIMDLEDASIITLSTEKAVSERLVAPILAEIGKRNDFIQIFSGEIIVGDKKQGLNGEIDFIFSRIPWTLKPKNPLLCVTESKLGLVDKGVGQAAAQMLGVRFFNQKHGYKDIPIHGVVTDGKSWRFLKLENSHLFVDKTDYSTTDLPLVLGVLQEIIDFYKISTPSVKI
ncbi:MAG: hypothetical protein U5L45_24945 [Saprospiraceae bacterium]|nr:hypothetical protein [Saprospiraceae bacterium]